MAERFLPNRSFALRWARGAAAGYLIVGVFGLAYAVTTHIDPARAIPVGLLAAAPLALAFLWHRLTSVKAFGVEVTLSQVTVDIDVALKDTLTSNQYFSDAQHLLGEIGAAVREPQHRLSELNLRTRSYWWSTRLFLQSALLDDYSNVERIVFVEDDQERRYVGMAKPRDVRRALAKESLFLEKTYQQLAEEARQGAAPLDAMIETLIQSWVAASFERGAGVAPVREQEAMYRVTAESLRTTLGQALETSSVDYRVPANALLLYRILDLDSEFVALVDDGRLKLVVDAGALARRQARATLERVIEPGA